MPLRVSTKYWAEDVGRPYQPAETYPGYSYLNFLEKPRIVPVLLGIVGPGLAPAAAVGRTRISCGGRFPPSTSAMRSGFEIDPPLAQKGFGNRPGVWGVFTDAQKDRIFWKWEFERYWLFYELWGTAQLRPCDAGFAVARRTDAPLRCRGGRTCWRRTASERIINEIVAAHLADPNMYIWPEINPGGLLDAYRDVLPSDWRYVASIPEAVENRIRQWPRRSRPRRRRRHSSTASPNTPSRPLSRAAKANRSRATRSGSIQGRLPGPALPGPLSRA